MWKKKKGLSMEFKGEKKEEAIQGGKGSKAI
jgi:hypothetical protein